MAKNGSRNEGMKKGNEYHSQKKHKILLKEYRGKADPSDGKREPKSQKVNSLSCSHRGRYTKGFPGGEKYSSRARGWAGGELRGRKNQDRDGTRWTKKNLPFGNPVQFLLAGP